MITKVPMDMLFSQNTGYLWCCFAKESKLLVHCIGPWMERISEIFNQSVVFKEERRQKSAFFYWDTSVFLKRIQVRRRILLHSCLVVDLSRKNEARREWGLNPVKGRCDV